jgi:hypothetical protein
MSGYVLWKLPATEEGVPFWEESLPTPPYKIERVNKSSRMCDLAILAVPFCQRVNKPREIRGLERLERSPGFRLFEVAGAQMSTRRVYRNLTELSISIVVIRIGV